MENVKDFLDMMFEFEGTEIDKPKNYQNIESKYAQW